MYNEYHHIDKPCRAIVLAFLGFKYQDYTLLPVNLIPWIKFYTCTRNLISLINSGLKIVNYVAEKL